MVLDSEYKSYITLATKYWTELDAYPTTADLILNVTSEVGELAEEYALYSGHNPHKRPATDNIMPVVAELGDIVAVAITAMIRLGFDPDDVLERQAAKVKARYPEWDGLR